MWAVLYRAAVTYVDVVWAVAVAFDAPKLHKNCVCFFIRQKNYALLDYRIFLCLACFGTEPYRFWITGYFCLWTRIRWNCKWPELKLFAHWTDNAKSIQLLHNKKTWSSNLGHMCWLKLNGELSKPCGALNCTYTSNHDDANLVTDVPFNYYCL